jgi:hypothetical protein
MSAGPFELDRVPMLLCRSHVTRLSIGLARNFPGSHLQLRGEGDAMRACHTRRAPASELHRAKTSQHSELERGQFRRTVYHRKPSQQGFGEGWAGMAEGSEKQELQYTSASASSHRWDTESDR